MPRAQVVVRQASREDADALARLWDGLLPRTSGEPGMDSDVERVATAIERHALEPDTGVLVADVEGEVAGVAYLRVVLFSPLDAEAAVHLSHLQVDSHLSTAEIGAELLDAALSWAEERGIGTFLAASTSTDRETNRLLARLGLGQVGVIRATAVPALRARLLPGSTSGRLGRATRRTGQVVAARRSQRRSRTGGLAL